MTWAFVVGVAAVAGAAGSWLPAWLARRAHRARLAAAVQLAEQLPGLVLRIEQATTRLTRVETRLDERDRRESLELLRDVAGRRPSGA